MVSFEGEIRVSLGTRLRKVKMIFCYKPGFPENKLERKQCGDIQIHEDLKVKLPLRCVALEV
jgi:hypothetical protein